jgi:hypothetical protein
LETSDPFSFDIAACAEDQEHWDKSYVNDVWDEFFIFAEFLRFKRV